MATHIAFISSDHQRVMATVNGIISEAYSRLTKGSAAIPKAHSTDDDDISFLTNSANSRLTSDSTARCFVYSLVKEISLQYNKTIDNLHDDIEEAALTIDAKDAEIAALKAQMATIANNGMIFDEESNDNSQDNHDYNLGEDNSNNIIIKDNKSVKSSDSGEEALRQGVNITQNSYIELLNTNG